MRFRGLLLNGLIENVHTRERFSIDPDIKKFFGNHLSDFVQISPIDPMEMFEGFYSVTDESSFLQEVLVSAGLAWNENTPFNIYPYYVVDFSEELWMEMKSLSSDYQVVQKSNEVVNNLRESGIIPIDPTIEKKRHFITLLRKNDGMLTKTCREAGVSRKEHSEWMTLDKEYRAAIETVADGVTDDIHHSLIVNAKLGDFQSQKLFLETHARDRGFGTKDVEVVTRQESSLPLDGLTLKEQETLLQLVKKAEEYQQKLLENQ